MVEGPQIAQGNAWISTLAIAGLNPADIFQDSDIPCGPTFLLLRLKVGEKNFVLWLVPCSR